MSDEPTIDDLVAKIMAESERLARRAVVAELENTKLRAALDLACSYLPDKSYVEKIRAMLETV